MLQASNVSADLSRVPRQLKPNKDAPESGPMHAGHVIITERFMDRVVISTTRAVEELVSNATSAGSGLPLLIFDFQTDEPFCPLSCDGKDPEGRTLTFKCNTYMDDGMNNASLFLGSTKGTDRGSSLQTVANEHGGGMKNAASAFGGQPNVLSMTQTSDAGQPFAMKGCCTFYAKSMAEVYAHHADNDHDTVQGLTMAWFKFSAEIVGSEIRVTHVELPEGKLADLVLLAKHPFSVQGESYLDITPRNAPEIRSANKGRLRECCKRIAEDFLETRDAFDEQPPSENRKAKAAATSGWGKKKRERGLVIAPRGAK